MLNKLIVPSVLQNVFAASMGLLTVATPFALTMPLAIASSPSATRPISVGEWRDETLREPTVSRRVSSLHSPTRPISVATANWHNPQLWQTLSFTTDPNTPNTWDFRVALSPSGETLVGGDRTSLRVWNLETGELQRTIASFTEVTSDAQLGAIAFSPNGQWVAATLYDANSGILQLGVWDVATGQTLHRIDHPLPARGQSSGPAQPTTYPSWSSVIFSPDGRRIATIAGGNPQVDIWDVATGQIVQTLRGGDGWAIAFSHDGQQLARSNGVGLTSTTADSILLWNLANPGRRPQTLRLEDEVTNFVFTSDNRGLFVAVKDDQNLSSYIRRLNLATGHSSTNLFAFHWSSHLTFSPDSTMIIAGGPNSPMEIGDLQTGQRIAQVDQYFTWGPPTALSLDARTFAVADPGNQRIQIWRPGS